MISLKRGRVQPAVLASLDLFPTAIMVTYNISSRLLNQRLFIHNMTTEITSHSITADCLRHFGKGELFYRTDGLQFEQRRADLRRDYLEAHPGTTPEFREAILNAAATPGMTEDEVSAAWGLLEEDTRMVFGNVTEDRLAAYAYFTGFAVGTNYTLYLKDDVVVGIREADELVPPHKYELDMRLAEESQGLYFFWDSDDGHIRGSDVDQVRIDWDTLHHHLYRIEPVAGVSAARIERLMKSKGLLRQYEIAFVRLGYDSRSAPDDIRSHIALSILPYSDLRQSRIDAMGTTSFRDNVEPRGPSAPMSLPPSSLKSTNEPKLSPPDEWLALVPKSRQQEATFSTFDDGIELLKVEWEGERLFRIDQVPLLVNGVSLYDIVEVEWQDGKVIPRFKRLVESRGHRTIRGVVTEPNSKNRIKRFAETVISDPKRYRFEKDVLALTIAESELDEITKEWLGYLPLSWIYTDTLTQQ